MDIQGDISPRDGPSPGLGLLSLCSTAAEGLPAWAAQIHSPVLSHNFVNCPY